MTKGFFRAANHIIMFCLFVAVLSFPMANNFLKLFPPVSHCFFFPPKNQELELNLNQPVRLTPNLVLNSAFVDKICQRLERHSEPVRLDITARKQHGEDGVRFLVVYLVQQMDRPLMSVSKLTYAAVNHVLFFYIVSIFSQTPLGLDYKDCVIVKNEHYRLSGVRKSFSSLRELTKYYQNNKLLVANVPVMLARCCPPRPTGMRAGNILRFKLG